MAERQVTVIVLGRNCHMPTGPTSLGPPIRQVLQRSLPLLAKRNCMPSLHPSRSKHWTLLTRQSAKSLPILEERSPQPQAMRGRELFTSREFRYLCNATTLYCYMSPCQPLTART